METIEIGKGINIHLIHSKKFKTTLVCVLIYRPLRREEATINALIPNILARGCSKYDTMEKINSHMENMYGSVFDAQIIKKGEQQIYQFYMEFTKGGDEKDLFATFDFIKEIMIYPLLEDGHFKESYVEQEKENLKIAIQSRQNNKSEYAKLRLLEQMCKNEHFGVYGDGYLEDLDDLNSQNVYKHYMSVLKESPIDIVVVGDENIDMAVDIGKNLFVIERGDILDIALPELNYNPCEVKEEIEDKGLTQGKICMGIRTGINPVSEDFYSLLLTNEILGGGANSKLFTVIREKESLCYYVSSFIYRFKSIILVQSGMDCNNFKKYISLVYEQIEKIKHGDFSDEEMENAKKSLNKKFVGIFDYQSLIMDFNVSQLMFLDKDSVEDVIEKVKNTNKDAIFDVAQKFYVDTIYMLK